MMPTEQDAADRERAWRKGLTDQRIANLWQLADIIGDMSADGVEVLRRMGDPDYKHLTKFLHDAKPSTFEFLAEARDAEIKELQNGIELVRAFRTTGRFAKWAIISLGTTLAAALAIISWWKGPVPK